MKKIFKLLPVALGLVALASCSSDDLFEGNAATPDVASAITGQAKNVGVEEFGSTTTTRSAIVTKNNGKHATMWNTSDKFRVYDTDLSKYDTYTYNATDFAFTKEGTKRVTGSDIAWALFPADRVSWTSYDEATGAVKVIFTIKDNITYDGNSEASYTYTSNGVSETNMGYLSNLPMFGVAKENATYGVEVPNMKYTTGILGVTLDNVQSKATWLRVKAGDDENIAGSFEVELKDNAVLKEAAEGDVIKTPSNIIYVNLENAPRTRAIVYLPIIAQDYTDLDVSFSASAATDPASIGEDAWTSIDKFADSSVTPAVTKTVARTEFLEVYYDFPLDTHTPEALTEVLSARTAVTGKVNLNIDYLRFSKDDTDSPDAQWYTIKVPNMAADEVHIKMPNGIDNDTKNRSKLVIADADATNPYTGKIIFDLSDGTDAATVDNGSGTPLAIDVNLLNADVELVGNYATTNLDIKNAKSLKFGNGTVATTVDGTVKTNQAASGYVSTIKESITVAANATLGKPFTIVGANTGKNAAFNVNIEGTTKAFVARYSEVTVSGDGQIGGTLYALGNVTVESSQNNAITTLHYAGNGKTLNLKKGGISVIKTIDYTSGTPAVPSTLNTLTITNVETGKSQIGNIEDYQTISATNTHVLDVTFEKSVWFGEATTSTSMKNPDKIYTASQFASLSTTDAPTEGYKLMTNIDLNDKAWAGVSIDKSFDGNDKTIENVNVKGTGAVSGGLFTKVTFGGDVEIKNLTVKNIYTTGLVASTAPAYPTIIGALVATANVTAASSSKAKITNVKIDAADNELGTDYVQTQYVGGLIGRVIGDGYLNIAGASASNKGTVALKKIKGHAYLGGLIGGMGDAAHIDIKNYTVTLSDGFTVNKPATIDSDYTYAEYGTVGMYIGQAKGNIQYDAANASDKIKNEREDLGFKYNHFTTTTTPQILHRFYGGNANIGYSPEITALTVGSTAATPVDTKYLTKTAYNALAAAAKLNPNIYIKSSEYPED